MAELGTADVAKAREFSPNANIWQELLQESARDDDEQNSAGNTSTVIVLGDKKNGKTALMNKLKSRVTVPDAPDYVLDYSYINVKNRFNNDGDPTLGRMGMWSLDDSSHASLLAHLCKDPSKLGWIITLDMSKPWSVEKQLDKWLGVVKEANEALMAGVAEGTKQAMHTKISKTVQFYKDPTTEEKEKSEPVAVAAPKSEAPVVEVTSEEVGAVKDEEKTANDSAVVEEAVSDAVEVDLSLPAINLGVPLLVVGLRADFYEKGLTGSGSEDKFEFLAKRLRRSCLEYGAALIFSSSVAEGTNISILQDYLYHRVLDFPCQRAPKVVGSIVDFGLFVPSGFDSASLIEAGGSSISMESKMEEVFPPPKDVEAAEEVAVAVEAQDNESFFASLKMQLEKGSPAKLSPARSAGGSPGESGSKASKKAVKSFFKSLLKDGSATDAASAIENA